MVGKKCQFKVTGWGYLRHGTSVYRYVEISLGTGAVTTDLTTTVVHNYKLLINDVKPFHTRHTKWFSYRNACMNKTEN